MQLPEDVKWIIQTLTEYGHEAYAVGGCVRDSILKREPQDWDITTSAQPEQVKEIFHHTIDTGIEHGTVTVMRNHVGYEVTTYRIDGEYLDGRHPTEVTYTTNLVEDLKRRDFTINAMAYNEENGLVDAFDGIGDLERKVIRCVGDPMERFSEDALRMLRAVRFAAQLGFTIAPETKEAIRKLAPTIQKVSAERIQVELIKLLTSSHPEEIQTAYELGLTAQFFPEFDEMMRCEQNNKHHQYTVGEHTVVALKETPADKVIRIATLLHDIAKPICRTEDEAGAHHFHGHMEEGAKMARAVLRRLKFDNDTTQKVCALVQWHDDRPALTQKSVRKAITRVGLEQYPALFAVKKADILAQSDYQRAEKLAYVSQYEAIYKEILEKRQCLSKKELAINGRDLLAMGVGQGKEIGKIIDAIFEQVLENPELNNREALLEIAHKMITPHI